MCAGMGTVTDLGINVADVVAFAGAGSISLAGEADVDLSSAFWGDFFFFFFFFFFAGDFNPIVRFLLLGLVWLLFRCSIADSDCRDCCCCGFCGDCDSWSFWWILLGAKFRYMPQLLTAPTVRASAFYNHHHLPVSADNGFRNCLKTLPSQAHPEYVVPVGRPGCRPKQVDLFNASIRAEERGQQFTCYKRRDVTDSDPNPTGR